MPYQDNDDMRHMNPRVRAAFEEKAGTKNGTFSWAVKPDDVLKPDSLLVRCTALYEDGSSEEVEILWRDVMYR